MPVGVLKPDIAACEYTRAMSQENVGVVRAMYEAANAGDKLEANFELLAPDVEFHVSGAFPDLVLSVAGHRSSGPLHS
jgi:hypothetical protein